MKNKGVLLFIILDAGFIGVVGNLCLDTTRHRSRSIAKPEIETSSKTVATGHHTRREVEVKPQISGIIETVHVEPGRVVKKGDLMVTIRVVPMRPPQRSGAGPHRQAQ